MPVLKTLPIIINSDIFRDTYILLRHIQPYCGTSKTLYRPCILITLPHSETWRIQTLIYIQNSVKRYPGLIKRCITPILRTLPYSESWKKFRAQGIFRTLSNIKDGEFNKIRQIFLSQRSILAV